jgi:hypothetical protein
MGAPFNNIQKTFSQAYDRYFIHYKWYYAERALCFAYMKCV